MDRLIALSQALAKRYDKHPLFEMVGFKETTLGLPGSGFDLRRVSRAIGTMVRCKQESMDAYAAAAQCELRRL